MRRSTTYVAVSTALATAVTSYAFIERPNFYSAAVHLSQSSACLIILSNAAIVYFAGLMYGLQSLLFGTLRPIEIEQLWERGWIAGTEWLFALSIFRDDFGVAYMASFILLFVSKVWGWMVDGRLELLEQQNPTNGTKFHARLLIATALNIMLPLKMATYCFEEAMYGPKSGIMTMFTFEFGILLIGAISTTIRYGLWFYEYRLVQMQLKTRMEEIRREAEESGDPVPPMDDMDVNDLDLPGWEAKSSFQFALDIGTDFLKFAAYLTFFGVLTVLYGLPIYIVRDLYMTGRSFYNRVNDYRQYRNATYNMHNQYPDATPESLAPDNTCIVCREDMKPWVGILPVAEQAAHRNSGEYAVNERQRPKQLPCGHILHFSCLRSWLERQQACPTCRRSVLRPAHASTNYTGRQDLIDGAHHGPAENAGHDIQRQQVNAPPHRRRARGWGFRLGPVRFFFGRLDGGQAMDRIRQMAGGDRPRPIEHGRPADFAPPRQGVVPAAFVPTPAPTATNVAHSSVLPSISAPATSAPLSEDGTRFIRSIQAHSLHAHLTALEDLLQQDIASLNIARRRVQMIHWLTAELQQARFEASSLESAMRHSASAFNNPLASTTGTTIASDVSQSILDPQGNILSTLPAGWTVVPLRPMPPVTSSVDPVEGASSLSAEPTMSQSVMATAVTPALETVMQRATSGPDAADLQATSPSRVHELTTMTNPMNAVPALNRVVSANPSITTPSATVTGANGVSDGVGQSVWTQPPNVSHGEGLQWSFDSVRAADDTAQQNNNMASSSSSQETSGHQERSTGHASHNSERPLQPSIEDLPDEDLD